MRTTPLYTFFCGWRAPFSNFHPALFTYRGVQFYTSEQFFMYCKAQLFSDAEAAKRISVTVNPAFAKKIGREIRHYNEKHWEQYRETVMYVGCREKFLQNKLLLDQLVLTTGTELVEASPTDPVWGVGLEENDPLIDDERNWRGQNLLGKILTQVRDDILIESASITSYEVIKRYEITDKVFYCPELVERFYASPELVKKVRDEHPNCFVAYDLFKDEVICSDDRDESFFNQLAALPKDYARKLYRVHTSTLPLED